MNTAKRHSTREQARTTYQAESPAHYLRTVFLERKSRNPSYSTRAFARDLGMSQTLLSLVWNGKRPLTLKQAAQITVMLGFSDDESKAFIEATLLALPEDSKAAKKLRDRRPGTDTVRPRDIDIERFKAISQWYHLPIFALATTQGFVPKPQWIARRLGISPVEARDALERLIDLGLLAERDGKVTPPECRVSFPTSKSEAPVREFHKQMITRALDQLALTDEASFNKRVIAGTTIAVNSEHLPLAREKVHKFRKEMVDLLNQSPGGNQCDEVYQLNVQWFPLTKNPSATPTRKESK